MLGNNRLRDVEDMLYFLDLQILLLWLTANKAEQGVCRSFLRDSGSGKRLTLRQAKRILYIVHK